MQRLRKVDIIESYSCNSNYANKSNEQQDADIDMFSNFLNLSRTYVNLSYSVNRMQVHLRSTYLAISFSKFSFLYIRRMSFAGLANLFCSRKANDILLYCLGSRRTEHLKIFKCS